MIITRVMNFPDAKVSSMCILDENGDYNIYLNARVSAEEQTAGYLHEIKHIIRGDFGRTNVEEVEREVRAG